MRVEGDRRLERVAPRYHLQGQLHGHVTRRAVVLGKRLLVFLSPFVAHTVGQVNLCLFFFMYHVFTGLFVIAEPERQKEVFALCHGQRARATRRSLQPKVSILCPFIFARTYLLAARRCFYFESSPYERVLMVLFSLDFPLSD